MSTFASFQSCAHSYFKLKLGFLSGQKFSCSSPLEGISQARAAGDTGQSKCKEPCARPTVKQMGATPVKPPLPCKSVLHVTKLKQRSTSSTWLQWACPHDNVAALSSTEVKQLYMFISILTFTKQFSNHHKQIKKKTHYWLTEQHSTVTLRTMLKLSHSSFNFVTSTVGCVSVLVVCYFNVCCGCRRPLHTHLCNMWTRPQGTV